MADALPSLPEPIDLERGATTLPRKAAKLVGRVRVALWMGICFYPIFILLAVYQLCSSEVPPMARLIGCLATMVTALLCGRWLFPSALYYLRLFQAAEYGTPFLYRDQETLRLVEAFRVYRSAQAYNALLAEYIAARSAIQKGTRPPFFDENRLRTGLFVLQLACVEAHIKLLRACLSPPPLPSQPQALPPLPRSVTLAAFEARVCDLN